MPLDQKQFEKMQREAADFDVQQTVKLLGLRERIEQKKGQVYVTKVDLRNTDPETGYYGDVYWRVWTVAEINEILANPSYQKQVRATLTQEPLTAEDQDALYRQMCLSVSHALTGESAMTYEDMVSLGDWRFCRVIWDTVAHKSGLTSSLVQDLDEFFRDTRRVELRRGVVRDGRARAGPHSRLRAALSRVLGR